jgi:pimeloyl-ACP methyl ester carboxylesterase
VSEHPDPVPYDEFSMLHENASEFGIPFSSPPNVERIRVEVEDSRALSALLWGTGSPEIVFLHGGAQNAHTWDTVALALGVPLLAVDLPGHGHSDGGPAGSLSVGHHARDVANVMTKHAPKARGVVGMSLGGLTGIALAGTFPKIVEKLVLVDITPGVNEEKAQAITSFIDGPKSFQSFDDLLERTVEFHPTRSVASLRRGILHNAMQLPDGSWVWRYARFREDDLKERPEFSDLWEMLSTVNVPVLLVRGGAEGSVVDDEDQNELLKRLPSARVEIVQGAGHSIQGDKPVELAHIIRDFVL